MTEPLTVAVLGLGEAGSLIAGDLVGAGADVRGYDPRGIVVEGVASRAGEAEAVADAELVLSVNSSHDAMTALVNALPALRPGTVWADLNTAAPAVKVALAEQAARRGVPVVDVALMSPVPGKGLRTPMLVSGEAADRYADLLGALGARVEVQPGVVGTAISRKLLRSVFYKGLAAAVVEALAGAEAAGCADWLHENISAELAGFDERTIDRLVEGTHTHARRRADEMAAATEQLVDLGVPARVAAAARDLLVQLRDAPSLLEGGDHAAEVGPGGRLGGGRVPAHQGVDDGEVLGE
jgi:3-hydroxyisobutyrate dehydrogenase-like beta-hydroxyacid dehydrogenase